MKLIYLVFLIALFNCSKTYENVNSKLINKLSDLEYHQNYFAIRDIMNKANLDLPLNYQEYYNGLVYSVFNEPKKSNICLNALIENSHSLPDSLMKNVFSRKVGNYFSLFEYCNAFKDQKILIDKYSRYIDSLDLIDAKKNLKMYLALKTVGKQRIIKINDVFIKLKKDKAGLLNLKVNFGLKNVDFVFDTGASISVIQESQAHELGLKILNVNIDALAITGKKIKSQIAVAKKIKINNLIVNNVVFLVFKDEDLSFPSANYSIKGIIGYPVIHAMEEIHLKKNNELFVPAKLTHFPYKNLGIDNGTPIVQVIYKNDSLSFSLDTGASSTLLYTSFYRKYKDAILNNHSLQKIVLGGAGGNSNVRGYLIDSLLFNIGGKSATLNNIRLNPKKDLGEGRLDGNLGHDFINHFQNMTISFKESSLIFE